MSKVYTDTANGVNAVKSALDEAVAANIRSGLLLVVKEFFIMLGEDRRIQLAHVRVLAAYVKTMNRQSGMCWPSYATIAAQTGLSYGTVRNTVCELRSWGYLIAEKRSLPQTNNRVVTVSTFGKIDHATIEREITKFVESKTGRVVTPRVTKGCHPPGDSHPPGDKVVTPQVTSLSPPGCTVTRGKEPIGITSEKASKQEGPAGSNDLIDCMIADIRKWQSRMDETSARSWLKTTFRVFGERVTRDAYQKLCTDIATGVAVADPLRMWSSIAQRMRDQPTFKPGEKTKPMSNIERVIAARAAARQQKGE